MTASIPKGVTIALERGDARIQDALWEATRETISDLEQYATTRIRKGGQQDDRLTGNLIAFAVEHPETRPAKADNMPDPDRHIHMLVFNLTRDPEEGEWKAVKFRPIMDLRKFFDRRFDQRLASKLTHLGYGIETKSKTDTHGGKRYFSWDIRDMPQSVVKTFSRRAGEVDQLAAELDVTNPKSKDKLGATSRQYKRKELTLAEYRTYWDAKISPEEARQVSAVITAAIRGEPPAPTNTADKAVQYAIDHHFERCSVIDWHDLAITAMERSMGGAVPEEIEPQARRQGVLLRNGEATTKDVLAEEGRIIAFARDGKGTVRPLGGPGAVGSNPAARSPERQAISTSDQLAPARKGVADLSPEQAAIARHVWDSTDRVILIRGAAGTGKTHTMRTTIAGIDRPVVVLAPSAEASRGVLRTEGFEDADTVARFLQDEKFQQQARNGVIWVDEAGLLGIRQVAQVFDRAKDLNARVVLQGDRRQHGSVERGATLRVLEEFAGLPVAELKDIRRQRGEYKSAVEALSKGDILAGYDKLAALGWVQQVGGNKPLVEDYLAGLNAGKEMLVVAPTHAEGDEITSEIREKLKERGIVSRDEKVVETLVPLGWTDAEKGDLWRYDGTEVLQFHRNSGTFRAGERVRVADYRPGDRLGNPAHFRVYRRERRGLAVGDRVRFTANGHDTSGTHRLNNGSQYTVAGFTQEGDLALSNGWTVAKDFGHITHSYVSTSHASQGKTVDRVLVAMGGESVPAMSAEQFYVSVSRGRESARVYSDLPTDQLRAAIQKTDLRKSATELFTPKPKHKGTSRRRKFMDRIRDGFEKLRDRFANDNTEIKQPERDMQHGR